MSSSSFGLSIHGVVCCHLALVSSSSVIPLPIPFPSYPLDFPGYAGRWYADNDTVMVHRRRTEDSGIEQVQAVPQTGRSSSLRRPPYSM